MAYPYLPGWVRAPKHRNNVATHEQLAVLLLVYVLVAEHMNRAAHGQSSFRVLQCSSSRRSGKARITATSVSWNAITGRPIGKQALPVDSTGVARRFTESDAPNG